MGVQQLNQAARIQPGLMACGCLAQAVCTRLLPMRVQRCNVISTLLSSHLLHITRKGHSVLQSSKLPARQFSGLYFGSMRGIVLRSWWCVGHSVSHAFSENGSPVVLQVDRCGKDRKQPCGLRECQPSGLRQVVAPLSPGQPPLQLSNGLEPPPSQSNGWCCSIGCWSISGVVYCSIDRRL